MAGLLSGEKDRTKARTKVREMLARFELTGLEKHRPSQLSGGQQQRVALARIFLSEPDILMLDEPFSALDSHLREKLQMELRELLKRYGRDVLLVTHSRDEAYHMCGQVAVLHQGTVLTQQETRDVFANPQSVQAAVLTGCKNIVSAQKSGEYAVWVPEWGVRLETAAPVRDGLRAIGIRAHAFDPAVSSNRFSVSWVGEMEEPFEWITQFRFANQQQAAAPVWRRFSKHIATEKYPTQLGVSPQDILLLYHG